MAALWVLGAGCGEPVADVAFEGEPLLSIEGRLESYDVVASAGEIRLALVWFQPDGVPPAGSDVPLLPEQLLEQRGARAVVNFPDAFTLNFFSPPVSGAQVYGPRALGVGLYAIGTVVIYADRDADGSLDLGVAPAEVLGSLTGEVIIHASQDLDALQSPTGLPLAAGYHAVPAGDLVRCGLRSLVEPGFCAVDVGAACADDRDCSGGRCLRNHVEGFDILLTYPNGYCLAPLDQCSRYRSRTLVLDGTSYTLRPCQRDADCRLEEGYACEAGACVPTTEPLCRSSVGAGCTTNAECGESAACLADLAELGALPGGSCVGVPTPDCRHSDAVVVRSSLGARALARCGNDAECRSAEGYVCAAATVCVPEAARWRCPVALGAPCTDNAACGAGGRCMTTHPEFGALPGGYCFAREWSVGCDGAGRGAPGDPLIAQACEVDSDCRTSEGYRCDPSRRACVPLSPGACPVPIGASCTDDDACSGGFCLRGAASGTEFTGGYCTVAAGDAECVVSDGVEAAVGLRGRVLLRGCADDSECGREGYRCNGSPGRCVPDAPSQLSVRSPIVVEAPVCR